MGWWVYFIRETSKTNLAPWVDWSIVKSSSFLLLGLRGLPMLLHTHVYRSIEFPLIRLRAEALPGGDLPAADLPSQRDGRSCPEGHRPSGRVGGVAVATWTRGVSWWLTTQVDIS